MPSEQQLLDAVVIAKGSAGLDGWLASEAVLLAKNARWIIAEAYALWVRTAKLSVLPPELAVFLWSWRTVGIPKRGTTDARPISVAPILARAWHKACNHAFLVTVGDQWCGRKQSTVAMAIASWLHAEKDSLAEDDLSKAFDLLSHDLLETAFKCMRIPSAVQNSLRHARISPRVCCVLGEISRLIRPQIGVAQGDPCSPAALVTVLFPWMPISDRWLFMDDVCSSSA